MKKQTQNEIKKLKKYQQDTDKRVRKIVGILEENIKLWKNNIELWQENVGIWNRFLKIFQLSFFLLLILIVWKDIVALIIWIWNSLSENWQTAVFGALWSLFLVFLTVFIDRKLRRVDKN